MYGTLSKTQREKGEKSRIGKDSRVPLRRLQWDPNPSRSASSFLPSFVHSNQKKKLASNKVRSLRDPLLAITYYLPAGDFKTANRTPLAIAWYIYKRKKRSTEWRGRGRGGGGRK